MAISLSPLITFTVFSKLLTQLRNKIWGEAAAEPRDVHLKYVHDEPPDQLKPPAILLATRESRSEALRYYTACRESKRPEKVATRKLLGWFSRFFKPVPTQVQRTVWVNFVLDHLVWTKTRDWSFPFAYDWATKDGNIVIHNFNFEDRTLNQVQRLRADCGQRCWRLDCDAHPLWSWFAYDVENALGENLFHIISNIENAWWNNEGKEPFFFGPFLPYDTKQRWEKRVSDVVTGEGKSFCSDWYDY